MDSDLCIRAYRADDWPALCRIHDGARKHELDAAGLGPAYLTLEMETRRPRFLTTPPPARAGVCAERACAWQSRAR